MHGYSSDKSLNGWQLRLAAVYGEANLKRQPLETFARVFEMCSGMARSVHRDADDSERTLGEFAPRALAWILGLASQLDVDLERSVWDAYPGICPHCRNAVGCVCRLQPTSRKRLTDSEVKTYQAKHGGQAPQRLFDWQGMFHGIYGPINDLVGEPKCLLAFFEELGEISEMIRFLQAPDSPLNKDIIQQRLSDEFADLFAWYSTVCAFRNLDIDVLMWDIYKEACNECNQIPCTCDPHHAHPKVRLSSSLKGES
jgi:NTP pyrophosphatase (non-canonical NTP hydrolase)